MNGQGSIQCQGLTSLLVQGIHTLVVVSAAFKNGGGVILVLSLAYSIIFFGSWVWVWALNGPVHCAAAFKCEKATHVPLLHGCASHTPGHTTTCVDHTACPTRRGHHVTT